MDRFLIGLNIIHTDPYGDCLSGWEALVYAQRKGAAHVGLRHGLLTYQFLDGEHRQVEPVFVNGIGWVYPVAEIDAF